MKIKKLWIAAASFGISASLLATVLTACAADDIDDDQKITLDDTGKLVGGNPIFDNINFTTAIQNALKISSSWATFKQALADELVYQWYCDRAADSEDDKGEDAKNVEFKSNLNKWNVDVDEEYDKAVQSCKDKYNKNYKFYLQNEYLSPNGGTEETYKHVQLVQKVKDDFISKAWTNNYFGWSNDKTTTVMPRYFADASMSINDQELLNNPETWNQLGFFATVNPEYPLESKPSSVTNIKTPFLARNPDGDYATIQSYVFDRWFRTEKPFFSAAALFKYSAPKYVSQEGKLTDIYNGASIGVTVPDAPNEAYPFFGGVDDLKEGTGTRAYLKWFENLEKGAFYSTYRSIEAGSNKTQPSNGTVTIPANNTEDSQTLLLAYGSQMIGGSSSLYVPYATAAAQLYLDMVSQKPIVNTRMNVVTKAWLERGLSHYDEASKKWIRYTLSECGHDKVTAILHNFFIPGTGVTDPDANVLVIKPDPGETPDPKQFGHFNSFVDIKKLYGGSDEKIDDKTTYFHSDLFAPVTLDKQFDFFYGKNSLDKTKSIDGIRFITNTVKVDDLKSSSSSWEEQQPWILELNEAGMHAQTIDGYFYIKNQERFTKTKLSTEQALKNVVKYRLMQKKCEYDNGLISADVFGDSGALKTYFTNNFADIILEMALHDDSKTGEEKINIFRKNEDYNKDFNDESQETLFEALINAEGFNKTAIVKYITDTNDYDNRTKYVDACVKANDTIFAYRKEQITNSKSKAPQIKGIYKNCLLAPIAYSSEPLSEPSVDTDIGRTHDYCVAPITYLTWVDGEATINKTYSYSGKKGLGALMGTIRTDVDNLTTWSTIPVDSTENCPFSPQIKAAKKVNSNRFWYKSAIVDKFMYSAMGNADTFANQVKTMSYDQYVANNETEKKDFENKIFSNKTFKKAFASTWEASQLFNGDKNYSSYFGPTLGVDDTFFKLVDDTFNDKHNIEIEKDGAYGSTSMAYSLFKATVMYLILDSDAKTPADIVPFNNFYRILNSKIGEDEPALIGYVDKLIPILQTSKDYELPTSYISNNSTVYDWQPNVDNIFDQVGYATGSISSDVENSKVASDQYWNVIQKSFNFDSTLSKEPITKTLAGFTGLQTKSSNTLDDCIKDAVFSSIAKYTSGSRDLSKCVSGSTPVRYEPNRGAWFAFAGSQNAKGRISFETFKFTKDGKEHVISPDNFVAFTDSGSGVSYDTSVCLRLAKKMVNYSSMQDLKGLAKELGESYFGESIYRQIGSGERTFTDINEMKFEMLDALPRCEKSGDTSKLVDENGYYNCFQRLTNVEVHSFGQDGDDKQSITYCFDNGNGNGYKMMLTQINKADVVEKTLTPFYDENAKNWVQVDPSGKKPAAAITPDEFFFLLCQTACESSVQSLAITQVVKSVFADPKLLVYDANLYNVFDSIWIKDWTKKPIGV